MKKNVIIISLLVTFAIVIVGFLIFNKYILNNDIEKQDTFSIENSTGKLIVKGYPIVKKIELEGYYPSETYEYVYFNIIESNSQNFLTYLENSKGNTFVLEKAIGIGCVENESLSYVNHSDKYGMKGYNLSKEDTIKIMNATKDNPITLELERLELTSPGDAPNCYSHITTIKIVD